MLPTAAKHDRQEADVPLGACTTTAPEVLSFRASTTGLMYFIATVHTQKDNRYHSIQESSAFSDLDRETQADHGDVVSVGACGLEQNRMLGPEPGQGRQRTPSA